MVEMKSFKKTGNKNPLEFPDPGDEYASIDNFSSNQKHSCDQGANIVCWIYLINCSTIASGLLA